MPARSVTSVARAAAQGSHRDLLVSMRDLIAKELDKGVAPRDIASLTKRLLELRKEIEAVDAAESADGISGAVATPDAAWPAA